MSGLAGALRERVVVERFAGASDGAGGSAGAWETVATVWAAVRAQGFGPAVEAERVERAPRYRVTLRAMDGLSLRDRLRWRERVLAVLSLARDPATPDRMELLAEEKDE